MVSKTVKLTIPKLIHVHTFLNITKEKKYPNGI